MSVSVGQSAPDFTLVDSDKQRITLSTLRGQNVLLLFFPAAFTSTCTKELCQTRDELSYYNSMNCKVFGISTDTLWSLAKYKEEQKLNFQLLADYNKDVTELYGVAYKEFVHLMRGTSKRSSFVIDKEGIVRFAEVQENSSELPNFEGIKAALASLN